MSNLTSNIETAHTTAIEFPCLRITETNVVLLYKNSCTTEPILLSSPHSAHEVGGYIYCNFSKTQAFTGRLILTQE